MEGLALGVAVEEVGVVCGGPDWAEKQKGVDFCVQLGSAAVEFYEGLPYHQ
jgi:hypothetical protein